MTPIEAARLFFGGFSTECENGGHGAAEVILREPREKDDKWWLDVCHKERRISLFWRPEMGETLGVCLFGEDGRGGDWLSDSMEEACFVIAGLYRACLPESEAERQINTISILGEMWGRTVPPPSRQQSTWLAATIVRWVGLESQDLIDSVMRFAYQTCVEGLAEALGDTAPHASEPPSMLAREWFFLSFASAEKGFLGGAFIESTDPLSAMQKAHRLGCNPGGAVRIGVLRHPPADQYRNRLLDDGECDLAFAELMRSAARKNTWPCEGKPEELKAQPIGQYHCEVCGEMQIAGMPHLPPQFPEQWEEPFPKVDYSDVTEPN